MEITPSIPRRLSQGPVRTFQTRQNSNSTTNPQESVTLSGEEPSQAILGGSILAMAGATISASTAQLITGTAGGVTAVAAVGGLLAGFAAGYVIGQRAG